MGSGNTRYLSSPSLVADFRERIVRVGDLVEFSYGRVGGQIGGIGVLAEIGYHGRHRVLFMGKAYWVPDACISKIVMKREVEKDVKLN